MHTTSTICHCGLSLCIQGTLTNVELKALRRRFIPVYTGNSFSIALRLNLTAVYPCVYRELYFTADAQLLYDGLSLCIQGTLRIATEKEIEARFIPVYTGNSVTRRSGNG